PVSVCIFICYLLSKFLEGKKYFTLFDPACRTGNLLFAVMNQQKEVEIEAFGSEVDPTLIRLAFNNSNLQEKEVELFHQDSLKPILLSPVDVVVSDLPVGYYPDDANASGYELKADEGHSYAHYLFIEQSIKYTKEGGYIFLLVPSFMFASEEQEQLQSFLQKHTYITGLLELPKSMFKDESFTKSIFVLQKKGNGAKKPNKVLLAELPSFKDVQAMDRMLVQINN